MWSPAPASSPSDPVQASSPSPYSNIGHNNVNPDVKNASGGGGMSAGKKAGIVVGVLIAACLVVVGGLVYKKRRDNIRRSQYGYAARAELL
ncbi:hypothetical protein GOBAR_DD33723 [Gossypium barbadense]|nr:hypothetical protein GOBAR_DD33723 [Gossypium barbadense]